MPYTIKAFLFALCAMLTACGGKTNFSGATGAKPHKESSADPEPKAKKSHQKVESSGDSEPEVIVAPEEEDDHAPSQKEDDDEMTEEEKIIQDSTPENPIDVKESGFACAHDMTVAEGPWSGTFSGIMYSGTPVSGVIHFTMEFVDKESLHVENYKVLGGANGENQIDSASIDFTLRCKDHSMPEAETTAEGIRFRIILGFETQSWTPPSLTGTWDAHEDMTGASVSLGIGRWEVHHD